MSTFEPPQTEDMVAPIADLADAETAALLRHLGAPPPAAEARVRRALERSLREGARTERTWLTATVGGLSGALLVAVGLLVLPRVMVDDPVSVARTLNADLEWRSEPLGDDVAVSFQGVGEVAGDSRAPRIQWDRGEIHVEVEPNRGIDLRVETHEASVRVVGTGFTVGRDALGTRVEVQHGRVEVQCAGEPGVFLDAGDTRTCLPTSAGGMLGRARELESGGAEPSAILAAVDRGLSLGEASPAVRDELSVMRIHQLLASGETAAAVDAGQAYLARTDRVRALEVTRMVAAAQLSVGGCAGAYDALQSAASLPGADADDATARDACRAQLGLP